MKCSMRCATIQQLFWSSNLSKHIYSDNFHLLLLKGTIQDPAGQDSVEALIVDISDFAANNGFWHYRDSVIPKPERKDRGWNRVSSVSTHGVVIMYKAGSYPTKLIEIPTSISAFPHPKALDGQIASDTLESALLDPNSEVYSKLSPEHDYSIYFDDQAPILADNLGTFQDPSYFYTLSDDQTIIGHDGGRDLRGECAYAEQVAHNLVLDFLFTFLARMAY